MHDGRCAPAVGPKSGDSPGAHRPASTRPQPRADRCDAQPARRRPDPDRVAQPARWWPTGHPLTAPPRRRSRTLACTMVDVPRLSARNQAIRPARIDQRRPASSPAPTGATLNRHTGGPNHAGRLGRGSTVADRPPPAHRTPHDIDQGLRYARRSMHPDRRSEIGRFARHASANLNPPAAPHQHPIRQTSDQRHEPPTGAVDRPELNTTPKCRSPHLTAGGQPHSGDGLPSADRRAATTSPNV
jgi:hypothetical protein